MSMIVTVEGTARWCPTARAGAGAGGGERRAEEMRGCSGRNSPPRGGEFPETAPSSAPSASSSTHQLPGCWLSFRPCLEAEAWSYLCSWYSSQLSQETAHSRAGSPPREGCLSSPRALSFSWRRSLGQDSRRDGDQPSWAFGHLCPGGSASPTSHFSLVLALLEETQESMACIISGADSMISFLNLGVGWGGGGVGERQIKKMMMLTSGWLRRREEGTSKGSRRDGVR